METSRSASGPFAFVLLLAAVVLTACRAGGAGGAGWTPAPGTYYTRFDLRLERDACASTNYRLEAPERRVPINTPLEYDSAGRDTIRMRLADGQVFALKHVPKHTQDTLEGSFAAFFAAEPADLSSFTEDERDAIERGEVRPGMSREAVLAAIGPPPAVGTHSLESPVWKYWRLRFSTFLVHFGDDRRVTSVTR